MQLFKLFHNLQIRPDFVYSLVYDNFFQRSNIGGRNKNNNKMSQKTKQRYNMKKRQVKFIKMYLIFLGA